MVERIVEDFIYLEVEEANAFILSEASPPGVNN